MISLHTQPNAAENVGGKSELLPHNNWKFGSDGALTIQPKGTPETRK